MGEKKSNKLDEENAQEIAKIKADLSEATSALSKLQLQNSELVEEVATMKTQLTSTTNKLEEERKKNNLLRQQTREEPEEEDSSPTEVQEETLKPLSPPTKPATTSGKLGRRLSMRIGDFFFKKRAAKPQASVPTKQ